MITILCLAAAITGWTAGYNMGRMDERNEKLREMLEDARKPAKHEPSDCPERRIS